MVKRKLTILLAAILLLTGALTYGAVKQYKYLEYLTYDYSKLDWVVEPGTYEAIWSMGFDDSYCFCVDKNSHYGVLDAKGDSIIPCKYDEVFYYGGDYLAAADRTGWTLFDTKGSKKAVIDKSKLNYAGGKYFIEYENISKKGFKIIDAAEGKIVKEYPDYYNAIKLDDGNWYISTNFNEHITPRWIGSNDTYYDNRDSIEFYDYYLDQKKYEPTGFFADENFNRLLHGKEYNLLLMGNGHYIADEVQNNEIVKRAVLNENGELYTIEKEDKINRYIESDDVYSMERAWKNILVADKAGDIGLKLTNDDYALDKCILYFDEKQNEIIKTKIIHGKVEEITQFDSLIIGLEPSRIHSLRDKSGKQVLDPAFNMIEVLSGGKTAVVSTGNFTSIINLERGNSDVSEND